MTSRVKGWCGRVAGVAATRRRVAVSVAAAARACMTMQCPVSDEITDSSRMRIAPPLMRTAPDMAPTSLCARCSMRSPERRHATREMASTVGPSVPITTVEPTGPTPTISTGFSRRSRSWYTPGSISSTSNGRALAMAALMVGKTRGSELRWSTHKYAYVGGDGTGAKPPVIIFIANRRSFCVCPLSRKPGAWLGICAVTSWRHDLDQESRRANSCFQLSGSRSAFDRLCSRNACRQTVSSTIERSSVQQSSSLQSSRGPRQGCWTMVSRTSDGSESRQKLAPDAAWPLVALLDAAITDSGLDDAY
jgi:hypothetical protein